MTATTEKDTAMVARLSFLMAGFKKRAQELRDPISPEANRRIDAISAAESAVATAAAEALGQETIDCSASFFELGGHSIHAVRLLTKLRRELAPTLTIRAIFEAESLNALAAHIENLKRAAHAPEREEFVF